MRVGRYVLVRDAIGLRHAIRPGSVVILSDADELEDETILQLPGGRCPRILASMDEVMAWLD